jgi:hypothetical protein
VPLARLLTVVLSLDSYQSFIHCELSVGLPLISQQNDTFLAPKGPSTLLTLDHAVLHRSYLVCPPGGRYGAELHIPDGV